MSYVPPHKRKGVELKPSEFPSLSDNTSVKAGAGGPTYVSKLSTSAPVQAVKEKITFDQPFRKTFTRETKEDVQKVVVDKDESEWVTKESKSSKKIKPDSEWDGFDY
jgi:hypothetical protein